MKCFHHHDRDAVALCSWCVRGLCPACAVEVGDRLACRDRCEAKVERASRVGQAGSQMVEDADRARALNRLACSALAAFVLIVGILIAVLGYTRLEEGPLVLLLGVALDLFGVLLLVVAFRWPSRRPKADPEESPHPAGKRQ